MPRFLVPFASIGTGQSQKDTSEPHLQVKLERKRSFILLMGPTLKLAPDLFSNRILLNLYIGPT